MTATWHLNIKFWNRCFGVSYKCLLMNYLPLKVNINLTMGCNWRLLGGRERSPLIDSKSGTSLLPPHEHGCRGSAVVERGSAGVERRWAEGREILQGRRTSGEGCGAAWTLRTNNVPGTHLEEHLRPCTEWGPRRPGSSLWVWRQPGKWWTSVGDGACWWE